VGGRATAAAGPRFEPAQRRTAAERLVALHRALPGQIVPQRIVVIEILVAQREAVDALTQQIDLLMGDQIRMARIGQRRIQRAGQPEASIGLAQKHHATVAGDLPALETRLDFAPIEAWKNKQFVITLWH
jgi:hypothetical protein